MELTIIVAIIAFLAVTLLLVGLLLFAKAKLTSSGEVTIDINGGEKVITTESGSTLLATLANNKVFLPSACGGGGSCGMCKCQVIEGGGDILPTETGFITRKMAKEHWRLGCQVKVKENLKIQVPEAVLGVKKWECTVVSNRNISTFLKEFVVKLPEGENLKFRSGGYIQIDIPKYDAIKFSDMDVDEAYRADWDKFKMWDLVTTNPEATFRAYSMANHPAEGNIIMLNIRIATPPFDRATGTFAKVNPGICSSYIFSRKPGDKVTISGPYGEFFLPDNLPDTQELIFIGGGAGEGVALVEAIEVLMPDRAGAAVHPQTPCRPPLAPAAAAYLRSAGAICYPMGSFYTSVLANLLPQNVGRAVAAVQCPKIFIPNTGTDAELHGLTVAAQPSASSASCSFRARSVSTQR